MDKCDKKEIDFFMKTISKGLGFKQVRDSFYQKRKEGLHIVNYAVSSKGFTCYSWIKEDRLDDILWDVLDMSDNKKHSYSIHVNGAFSAPSMLICEYFYDEVKNYEQVVTTLWNLIEQDLNNFMVKNQNAIEHEVFYKDTLSKSESIIKCLYLIDKGKIALAIDLAKSELAKGNKGKFSNAGKYFYERVCSLKDNQFQP
jgi:hypothetical protein